MFDKLRTKLSEEALKASLLCMQPHLSCNSRLNKLEQEAQLSQKKTAQRFLSLNILLSHSFATTLLSRACVSPYWYFNETMSVCRTVSEIFSIKNGVTLKPGVGIVQGQ